MCGQRPVRRRAVCSAAPPYCRSVRVGSCCAASLQRYPDLTTRGMCNSNNTLANAELTEGDAQELERHNLRVVPSLEKLHHRCCWLHVAVAAAAIDEQDSRYTRGRAARIAEHMDGSCDNWPPDAQFAELKLQGLEPPLQCEPQVWCHSTASPPTLLPDTTHPHSEARTHVQLIRPTCTWGTAWPRQAA